MTDEQKAAYVHAQAVSAQVELEAMLQANREREAQGKAPAYSEEQIRNLQVDYCISHNATLELFHIRP